MSDLINREDAIKCIRWGESVTDVIDRINALPSAEAVHIEIYRELYEKYVDLKHASADAVQGVGRYEKAMQKLREMPRCLNGVKVKQINKIQSEAVQGEWKIDEYGIYHCPFCHAINNTVYKSFCPNCGARMKGGDSE